MSVESDTLARSTKSAVLRGPTRRRPRWGGIVKHAVLVALSASILLPLAWVLLLSIKSLPDAYTNTIWPKNFDLDHYSYALSHVSSLPRNMANSVFVTIATILLTTICAVLAGYAWDEANPFVMRPERRLTALAEVCRRQS